MDFRTSAAPVLPLPVATHVQNAAANPQDLATVLDALVAHVLILDTSGRVRTSNRAFRKFARGRNLAEDTWRDAEYVSSVLPALGVPDAKRQEIGELLDALLADRRERAEMEFTTTFEGAVAYLVWEARALHNGGVVVTHHDVSESRALHTARERFERLADANTDGILIVAEGGGVIYSNDAANTMAGGSDALGALVNPTLLAVAAADGIWRGELTLRSRDGAQMPVIEEVRHHRDPDGTIYFTIALHDVSEERRREEALRNHNIELELAYKNLQTAQEQLLQSEKMASIGQLAAGVAHEINNPIGYVHSNLGTLQDYSRNLLALVQAYERALRAPAPDASALDEVDTLRRRIDLDYLVQDLPQLIAESREGIERVKKIVQDLKDFSHAGHAEELTLSDLHRGLDSTLNIVWNELKYKAELDKRYGVLPLVECLPSQINQVFMNMLVNAGQAIERRGTITIETGVEGDDVWIEISDTGAGMTEQVVSRIFDPFFTTKAVGTGTGLGLSLSYGIVKKHHGRIDVRSEPGKGTTFRIVLPQRQPRATA